MTWVGTTFWPDPAPVPPKRAAEGPTLQNQVSTKLNPEPVPPEWAVEGPTFPLLPSLQAPVPPIGAEKHE